MGIIIKDGIQYGRTNPSGLDDTDHVIWASHAQNLTDAQKQTARTNISAASIDDMSSKVAIQQGSGNAGKALVVGEDGAVTLGEAGVPAAVKVALLALVQKLVYVDGDGQQYYDALYEALNGSV